MLLKCCTQYVNKFGKLNSGHRTGKCQFTFQSESNSKECSDYHKIALISHGSKVMLKILQARLQQYVNWELPDVQAGIRKGREEPEIKLPRFIRSSKKQENSRKTSTSALLIIQSLWLYRSQQTLENSSRDVNTRPPDLPLEKSVCK